MTQSELAGKTGIPRRHISEMEHGKRTIGKQKARKLAAALGMDARRFLGRLKRSPASVIRQRC